jgi:hypothetical protein
MGFGIDELVQIGKGYAEIRHYEILYVLNQPLHMYNFEDPKYLTRARAALRDSPFPFLVLEANVEETIRTVERLQPKGPRYILPSFDVISPKMWSNASPTIKLFSPFDLVAGGTFEDICPQPKEIRIALAKSGTTVPQIRVEKKLCGMYTPI